MAKNKIYGLTVRQWTALLVIVIGLIVFGCRACYNLVRDRTSNNANVAVESNQTNKKPSRPTQNPASSLTVEQATEIYLSLGNPSGANNSDPNNFLMVKPFYALSYNRSRGTANWVSWRVTQADIGNVERANDFRPDPNLPQNFPRITPNDYTGSGFDRGHLVPSKDRSNTPEANSATFFMSNIVPQEPDSNQGVWRTLEEYSRNLVEQGNEIYVAAGVSGERGRLKNKVTIPASMWKVIAVLPAGGVSDINANTRIIAVDIPNAKGVRNDDWRKYRATVRQIEQKTGYNLFSTLPPNVQDVIETKMDSR